MGLNDCDLKIAPLIEINPTGWNMKNLMLKLVSCFFGMALIANPIFSEETTKDEEQQTLIAGTKKLDNEQHEAIKQKRLEQADEENERDEMVSNGMYFTKHPSASHGIYKTSSLFDRVELNDGSIWNVRFISDWGVVSRWMQYNDQVIICPGTIFDATDYLLVSQRTGEVVSVDLVELEVIIGDPYFKGQRLWINKIDYVYDVICGCFYYEIRLNDGSIWEIDTHDTYLGSCMLPGDVVLIGVDESLSSPTYNILVHFNSLEYVHADCVVR